MPTVALIKQTGEKVKDITLNDAVFGIEPNKQVLFDVINAQRAAMRQGTHDTKGRSEVRGGGRKPWRQKGTGRARAGTIRSPLWRGGGIVFGPTPRGYNVKLNKKVRQLGLRSALSQKVLNGEVIVLDTLTFEEAKTKQFVAMLNAINVSGKALFVFPEFDEKVALAARNIEKAQISIASHTSVLDILNNKHLVLTEAAVKYFEEVLQV